jgi:hypothetical protein
VDEQGAAFFVEDGHPVSYELASFSPAAGTASDDRAVQEVLGLTDRVSAKGAAEVVRQVAPPTRAWHRVESAIRGAEDDPFALHEIGQNLGRHARSVAQQGGPKQEVAAALAVEKAIVDAIDRPTGGEYSKARAVERGRQLQRPAAAPQGNGVTPGKPVYAAAPAKPVYTVPPAAKPVAGYAAPTKSVPQKYVPPVKAPPIKPLPGKFAAR